jgi:steroid delta-isomerase-like uncharacterized protein
MSEANKALVRRYFDEILNKPDLTLVQEIFSSDSVFRAPHIPEVHGLEARKLFITAIHTTYPDIHYTIQELIAEGDKVVARWKYSGTHKGEWMGVAPTGRYFSATGTTTLRISGGKIVEEWADYDAMGVWQQLGVLPPLEHGHKKG